MMRVSLLVLPALVALSATAVAAPNEIQPLRSDAAPAIQLAADTVIVTRPAPPPQPAAATVIIAPSAPPPPRTEVIPPAPSTEVVWKPGHWAWNGTQYVWVAGQYVARPRPEVAWVPGHWDQSGDGWTWVDGHWQ